LALRYLSGVQESDVQNWAAIAKTYNQPRGQVTLNTRFKAHPKKEVAKEKAPKMEVLKEEAPKTEDVKDGKAKDEEAKDEEAKDGEVKEEA
jgi:hypothetical protein